MQLRVQYIDIDFQNDLVFVFTDSEILTFYLKPATLQFSSDTVTETLDLVTIKAVAGDVQQLANIHFQVLSKDDHNLYQLQSLTSDLYFNRAFYSPINKIPINGISGPDIRVNAKVDIQVRVTPIMTNIQLKFKIMIQNKSYMSNQYPIIIIPFYFLFRRFEDLSVQVNDCRLNQNKYQFSSRSSITDLKQKVIILYPLKQSNKYHDKHQQVLIIQKYIYTDVIGYYYFPSGQLITKLSLSQFGKPQGTISRTYGDELPVFRFTSELLLIQRLQLNQCKMLPYFQMINLSYFIQCHQLINQHNILYKMDSLEFKKKLRLVDFNYRI